VVRLFWLSASAASGETRPATNKNGWRGGGGGGGERTNNFKYEIKAVE